MGGKSLALEISQKDKYSPKVTGIHTVFLKSYAGEILDDIDSAYGNHKIA